MTLSDFGLDHTLMHLPCSHSVGTSQPRFASPFKIIRLEKEREVSLVRSFTPIECRSNQELQFKTIKCSYPLFLRILVNKPFFRSLVQANCHISVSSSPFLFPLFISLHLYWAGDFCICHPRQFAIVRWNWPKFIDSNFSLAIINIKMNLIMFVDIGYSKTNKGLFYIVGAAANKRFS